MCFNVQSLNKRINELLIILDDFGLDLAFITETWLFSDHNATTASIRHAGFNILHEY